MTYILIGCDIRELAVIKPFNSRDYEPFISLIVPVFNERDVIEIFLNRTSTVLEQHGFDYEYVFVNDGSTDETLAKLILLSSGNPCIRIINLSRNFGKEAAMTAGIDHVRGNVLVPIDVDLQDPPELIPRFVEKWREGYDVVYGVRTTRNDDSTVKRVTAGWFYNLFNRLSPVPIPDSAGDFRLLDERAIEVLRQLPERNRFMKGLFAWVGFYSIGVAYSRPARVAGQTKWSLRKLWNFALDGIFSFSTTPLRMWSYVGILISLIAFLYATFIVTRTVILGIDLPGYASLLTVVLFLGGIQLISLGVIGEYLGRLLIEAKQRPVYVIEGEYADGGLAPSEQPDKN
jgi:glycosyltransferase involved in cell wall biosynthesis